MIVPERDFGPWWTGDQEVSAEEMFKRIAFGGNGDFGDCRTFYFSLTPRFSSYALMLLFIRNRH